jgi:hypothetical protein
VSDEIRIKQSQFARHRPGGAPAARAASAAAEGDKRVKQSQFAPDRPGRAPAARAVTAAAAGHQRAKQSQFLQSDTKGKYFVEEEL